MKKILFALVLALSPLFAGQASAAPCVSGTFASYAALGSSGCTVGTLTFTDFSLLMRPNGATPFPTLTVMPTIDGTQAGFTFVTTQAAAPGQLFDDLIAYRVVGSGSTINSATLGFVDSSSLGDASVTAVQNLCIGGLFGGMDGVSGCTGNALAQIIVDIGDVADPATTLMFASAMALAVVTDLGVDGGTDGAGFLAGATNLFNSAAIAVVPEPSSVLLLSIGLLGFIGTRLQKRRVA